jgi:hypothetical protein
MSACNGCGRPIVWAVDGAGKKIPFDPQPPIFMIVDKIDENDRPFVAAYKMDNHGPTRWMIPHKLICPNPGDFEKNYVVNAAKPGPAS